MSKKEQPNYYAIIPATVRYDTNLKYTEKLLYGEITALSNKNGYCYAQNKYFADLYNVTAVSVSRWISHLQQLGYIKTEVIRNENKEIVSRNIYIVDIPYYQKNQYPYIQKSIEGINKNVKDNNIKYNIDDLFILIINNSNEISREFYSSLRRLEFIYPKAIIETMEESNLVKIKEIIYTLFLIYNSNFKNIILKFDRENLIKLYLSCKSHDTDDFFNYYKRAIINKYTDTS